jgi:hypothetical protein
MTFARFIKIKALVLGSALVGAGVAQGAFRWRTVWP